jgi:glycine oxidase
MKHFLIVGAGIAGSNLAYQLLQQNCKVTLIHSGENHSSVVAAGQINPIVFRRMTLSWHVDVLMSYARNFYETLEKESGTTFLVDKSIRRMFAHLNERELWLKKQDLPEYSPYLSKLTPADDVFDGAQNICGSGRVMQSYYVQSRNFLKAIHRVLKTNSAAHFLVERFDYSLLDITKTAYKELIYDGVIFCEGYENFNNPFFSKYEVTCTKGQILTVSSKEIYTEESLNRKCFVMPLDDGTFRIGSTYEWDSPNTEISESAKQEICGNLESLVSEKYTVIHQEAGVRPTVADRRPIMGEHPDLKGLYIFNGLGAKGYMLAPLLSLELSRHILVGAPLDKEVDISRF